MQSFENKVISRIYGKKRGWVFTPNHFLDLGNRALIDKALSNLVTKGTIRRLARGLYDYPRLHPKLGLLPPSPDRIAEAVTEKDKSRFQPSGAYAANMLGLSEQVPAKIIFLTDGTSRTITIGKLQISFKKTTPKSMMTAGRLSGLIIQALRYWKQKNVGTKELSHLRRKLSSSDKKDLLKDIRYAPAWIGAIFRNLANVEDDHG